MTVQKRILLGVFLLLCLLAIARIGLLEPTTGAAVASPVDDGDLTAQATDIAVAKLPERSARESATTLEESSLDGVDEEASPAPAIVNDLEPVARVDSRVTSISGYLRRPDGEPILNAFATVTLTTASGDAIKARVLENGKYRALSVPHGELWLEADAEGFRAKTVELFLRSEQTELIQDVELEPRVVIEVCALTPDGEPLDLLADRLFALASNEAPSKGFINEIDNYEHAHGAAVRLYRPHTAPELMLGFVERLELLEQPPVYISLLINRTLLETQYVPAGKQLVTFVISNEDISDLFASVRYRLTDSESGDELTASAEMLFASNRVMFSYNATGEIVHDNIAPGIIELNANVEGYEAFKYEIDIEPGANLDLGDIPLKRSLKLEGVVVDQLGQPVHNAAVHYLPVGDTPPDEFKNAVHGMIGRSGVRVGWTTDVSGRFSIGLSSGRHRLWAVGPKGFDHSVNMIVDSEKLPAETRVVLHKRKQIMFTDKFKRYSEATLRIFDSSKFIVDEQTFTGTRPLNSKLPRGSYHAQLTSSGEVVLDHQFEVGEQDFTIDL